jgi:ribosomal protein S18 acetylase RimI-like enzyme
MMQIVDVTTEEQVEIAGALFLEYAASLGLDLGFQDFAGEMSRFPADYMAPSGALLLAEREGAAAGCVGVRRFDAETCEMKRLYVRAAQRGLGVGRALARAAIDRARDLGYRRMRLDTLPTMDAATALYRALGFRSIPPYRHNPVEGASFLELDL